MTQHNAVRSKAFVEKQPAGSSSTKCWQWLVRFLSIGVLSVGAAGCRCEPASTESAKGEPQSVLVERCRRNPGQVTLRATEGRHSGGQEQWTPGHLSVSGVAAPFSVEVGGAVAAGEGFWVSAQRNLPDGYEGLLARVSKTGQSQGEIRSLGMVAGDSGPPRLVAFDNPGQQPPGVVVALQQAVGSDLQMRFARVAEGRETVLNWQLGPLQAGDESNSYDLAAYSDSLLVAWDEWDSKARRGVALVSRVGAADDTPSAPAPWAISEPHSDAEAPRLSLRPGGYWAAWIVNAPRPSSAGLYDPEPERSLQKAARFRPSLAFGARWIQLLALDRQGRPVGKSRRVTPRQQRVVGFDLRVGKQGKAWLVWRAGAPSPAADGGQLSVALVERTGGPAVYPLRSEGVGAGEPAWISAGSGETPWLSFADDRDRSVLQRVVGFPLTSKPWQFDKSLLGASVLASFGNTLLFALPRGRDVELTTGQCGDLLTKVAPVSAVPGGSAGAPATAGE